MFCLFVFVWKIRDDLEQILNTVVGELKLHRIANTSAEKSLVLVVKFNQTVVFLADASLTLIETRQGLKDVILTVWNIL